MCVLIYVGACVCMHVRPEADIRCLLLLNLEFAVSVSVTSQLALEVSSPSACWEYRQGWVLGI